MRSAAVSFPLLVAGTVLSLALSLSPALAKLLQVQIVHRHGARAHLRKNALNPSGETTNPPLLPGGAKQLVELGAAVRERYYPDGGKAPPEPLAGAASNYSGASDARAFSSQLDRTLASSRSFLRGLYPGDQEADRVPTNVFGSNDADWTLRGYALCPAFTKSIDKFLATPDFAKRAAEFAANGGLKRAADKLDETDGTLKNAFNIYDQYKLSREKFLSAPLPAITDADFASVSAAAAWVESRKYATPAVAGGRAAGGIMGQLIDQSEKMLVGNRSAHRLIEYSAHYPLIMGIYAGLGLDDTSTTDFPKRDIVTRSIPEFGAALVWELHTGGVVRLLVRNGTGTDFTRIPCNADGKLECSMAAMKGALVDAGALFENADEFCKACGEGHGVNDAVCGTTGLAASDAGSSYISTADKAKYSLTGVLFGLLVAAVGILLWAFCGREARGRRGMRRGPIASIVPEDEVDTGSPNIRAEEYPPPRHATYTIASDKV
jgi:Histidine phosphatase superfamily (branch 2)